MATGSIAIEKVGDKSTVTRCFSKYPLKLITPKKVSSRPSDPLPLHLSRPSNPSPPPLFQVGSSSTSDAVWIYTLSYGGGIVSGDCVSVDLSLGDGCTAAMTTQASTKVYKSVGSKCSEQNLEARVGRNALLVVIPDPVTCFSTARYSQKQVFRVFPDSNLVIVDWITSGRHEVGENWDFELYKSTNHIFLEGDEPLFLDSVLLEERSGTSVTEQMQGYRGIAMVIILGPKLTQLQSQVQDEVKQMMSVKFRAPTLARGCQVQPGSEGIPTGPALLASCSYFGPKGVGLVVRIAATTTDSVYVFLRRHLASLEPILGISPYH